jgi:putative tryptophan/tyrosine transport system substrate-binding protein
MNRRTFITLIGGAAGWPLAARAQQPHTTKPVRIGVLASLPFPPLRKFSQKLKELGYVEGETLRLEYRFAEGHDNRYPILAAELVALPVDLILTSGAPAALAAKTATTTIPIVMGSIGEAISTGIVTNLARPGGNITGFAALNVELEGKRLELLKELVPNVARVGVLANTANSLVQVSLKNLRPAADTLGVSLDIFEIRDLNDVDGALLKLVRARPQGVLIAADTLLLNKRREIVQALAKSNLPAIYPFREYSDVGGLLVHGANLSVLFEHAAVYVDRILKGEAKPGDLPVQQATEFELIINLKAAAALGLQIPPSLLAIADEVIE